MNAIYFLFTSCMPHAMNITSGQWLFGGGLFLINTICGGKRNEDIDFLKSLDAFKHKCFRAAPSGVVFVCVSPVFV